MDLQATVSMYSHSNYESISHQDPQYTEANSDIISTSEGKNGWKKKDVQESRRAGRGK